MRYRIPIRVTFIPFAILVLALVTASCTDDRESYGSNGGNNTELIFSVNLPTQGHTYALNTADENAVSHINVLVFNYTGSQYVLSDWGEPVTGSIINDGASNKKKFTVKFTRLTEGNKYKFVILANAKSEVAALFSSGLAGGAEKNATLAALNLSGVTRWNMDTSDSNYRDIPMWGETPSEDGTGDVTFSNNITIDGLNLLRMIARINVSIDGSGSTPATNSFKLKSVSLYNTYQTGRIIPDIANLSSAPTTSVISPTLVTGSTPVQTSVIYDNTIPGCDLNDTQIINNIYTFESVVPRDGSGNPVTSALTCLVIGGFYGSGTTPTYYRIDLVQKDALGNVTYLDILRNYTYNLLVTKVKSVGYETPEEAFNAKASNIELELIRWDDAQISDIVYDGQYMLGVSADKFTLARNAQTINSHDNSLIVTTNYPSGWKVDKITDASDNATGWLQVYNTSGTAVSSGPNGTSTVKLILEENTTGNIRTAFIHLSAGRLVYTIEVIQGIDSELDLDTRNVADTQDISELVFTAPVGTQPALQQFLLQWAPYSATVNISNSVIGSNGFVFASGSDAPGTSLTSISDPSGEKLLNIQPTAITAADIAANPFFERNYKIDFTISNGESYLTKSVFFRQINYNLLADGLSGYNPPDGSNYSFKVRSNTNWRIKSVSEQITTGTGSTLLNLQTSDNLRVGTTGLNNTSPGTTITFRSVNNMSLAGKVTVVFESSDNPKKFDDVTLVLSLMNEYYPDAHSGWAGSNIYYDSTLGHLTFDDVGVTTHSNYQGVFFKWGSLYGISPQGAWATTTLLYPPAGGSATATSLGYTTWTNIPNVSTSTISSNPPSGKTVRDRAYLWEVTDGSKGDICKWLTQKGYAPSGKKWRMPTSKEFEAAASYTMTGTYSNQTSTSSAGQYTVNVGYVKSDTGNPLFPAAGGRTSTGGLSLPGLGLRGNYWSATPTAGTTEAYNLFFDSSQGFYSGFQANRNNSSPIRCVVD